MFFGLALFALGIAWMLRALGVFTFQTFGLIGGALLAFAGILKLMHLERGRKADKHPF